MSDYFALILGVVCAGIGGELFVRGAVGLAYWARVSPGIIGATVAAFATSSPELSVSINAAMAGKPQIALGDALGSNVVNVALILALALIISGIHIVSDSREEEHYALYPSPQQLIEAGEGGLRAQGVSRQKAATLLGIARRTAEGELERSAWATLSDEEALKRLCEIKGVGRWTAEIVLMRGLGRPDIFPAGDLGLQAALQELWGLPERPSEKAAREIAERWAGWRSYAAFYLWMILQSRTL